MKRIFVISDLHLGGRPDERGPDGRIKRTGFQFCHAYEELKHFARWLATLHQQDPARPVELVVNGDVVDFLADDDPLDGAPAGARAWTADPAEALARFERARRRTWSAGTEHGVFEAWRDMMAAGVRLTLLLGNHDLELSLLPLRRRLEEILGDPDGRLHFVYDGEAYTVGRLLIEHGNRYDEWNAVDHSRLRQERSVRSRGLMPEEEEREERYFLPPAGSLLVVQFMNRVKSRYRFVDLLKPEVGAVLPLLVALEPDHAPEFADVIAAGKVYRKKSGHEPLPGAKPRNPGDMGPGDEARWSGLGPMLASEVGESVDVLLPAGVAAQSGNMSASRRPWIERIEGAFERLQSSADAIARRAREATDAVGSALRDARDGALRARLRPALARLVQEDRTFAIEHEDEVYLSAARDLARLGGFDAVVFGHTHLPKRIALSGEGPPWYLNSGTWVDVMRLPPTLADEGSDGAKALDDFIEAIGRNDHEPYVRRYLSYVEAHVGDDDRVELAELRSFCGPDRPREHPLTELRGRE